MTRFPALALVASCALLLVGQAAFAGSPSGNGAVASAQASTGVFSATVTSTVNRVPKQISSAVCKLTGPSGAVSTIACGAQTSTSTSTTWVASPSSLNAGAYSFTNTITMTDGGRATASVSFTVKQVKPTCTVTRYSVTYDKSAHSASGSCTGASGVVLPAGNLDLSGTSHTAAGSYTDSWSFTDPAGNYTAASGTVSDVINKANATVSVTGYTVTYDGNAHAAAGSATGIGGTDLSSLLDLSGTNHTNAGTYNGDAWSFAGNSNYKSASGTVDDAIGQAGQTITFGDAPLAPATGGSYTPSATASSGLAVTFTIDSASGSNCNLVNGVVYFSSAGSCTVDADQAGNGNWKQAPTVQQTFTIASAQKGQTVSFTSTAPAGTNPYLAAPGTTVAYLGGPVYTPTAEATSGLTAAITVDPSSSSVCTFSGDKLNFIGVGTCTIDADQAGNDSWAAAPQAQQSFTVGRPIPVITVDPIDNPQVVTLPPSPAVVNCSAQSIGGGGCEIGGLDATYVHVFDSAGTLDPSADPSLYTVSYHWQMYKPPALGSAQYSSNGISGYHAPVLTIQESSMPELRGTNADAYPFWDVGFTVTINGVTNEPTLFKFMYTSSTLLLRISTNCQVQGYQYTQQCQLSASNGLPATEPV